MSDLNSYYNPEAEQSVLGSMLQAPEKIQAIRQVVKESCFYTYANRMIFKTLCEMSDDNQPIDTITLSDELSKRGVGEDAVQYSYLIEIQRSLPSVANCIAYAEIVKDKYADRRIKQAASEYSENNSFSEFISKIEVAAKLKEKSNSVFSLSRVLANQSDLVNGEVKPKRTVFNNCMPLGEIALVTAGGGTGKSYAAMQMGLAVACNVPAFIGNETAFIPNDMGRVLYIAAEDHFDDFKRRLSHIRAVMNIEGEEHSQEIKENFLAMSVVGEDVYLVKEEQGAIKDTGVINNICAMIKDIDGIRLVVIDPLSAFYGGKENVNEQATYFMNIVMKICKQNPDVAVMIIHHSSKGDKGGSRGASGFVDRVRTHLSMITIADEKTAADGKKGKSNITVDDKNTIVIRMEKSNHVAHWKRPIYLKRGDDEGGAFKTVLPSSNVLETLEEEKKSDLHNDLIAAVRRSNAGGQGISGAKITTDKEVVLSRYDTHQYGNNMIRESIAALVNDGVLKKEKSGYWINPNWEFSGQIVNPDHADINQEAEF